MKISDLTLRGTEEEKEGIKTILSQVPWNCISLVDREALREEGVTNIYRTSLEKIDHGFNVIIEPKYSLDAIIIDLNNMQMTPNEGGYQIRSEEDHINIFLCQANGAEVTIYRKPKN